MQRRAVLRSRDLRLHARSLLDGSSTIRSRHQRLRHMFAPPSLAVVVPVRLVTVLVCFSDGGRLLKVAPPRVVTAHVHVGRLLHAAPRLRLLPS